jgi:hypothetical protein
MTAELLTGSDLVVRALANAGGSASRSAVLRAVAQYRGRREAGMSIDIAIIGGRVEKTILADGVLGLRLISRGTGERDS